MEVDAGGNRVVKVVGDGYEIIAGSKNCYIHGDVNLTIGSNCAIPKLHLLST